MTRLFWNIQYAKLILLVVVAIAGAAALAASADLRGDGPLFLAALATVVSVVLTPLWLLTGFERMELTCITLVTGRLLTVPAILLLVHTPDHAWRAAGINSAGLIVSGLVSLWLVRHHRLVSGIIGPPGRDLARPDRRVALFLVDGRPSFYAAANPILLELVSSPFQVGLFGAADRVRQISLGLLPPFSQAFYPRISRSAEHDPADAARLVRRLMLLFVAITVPAALLLYVGAPLIVSLLMGERFAGSVTVLRIIAPILPLAGLNTVLGGLTLLPFGMKRRFSAIVLAGGAINLLLIALFGHTQGAAGAGIALLATEVLVLVAIWLSSRPLLRAAAQGAAIRTPPSSA